MKFIYFKSTLNPLKIDPRVIFQRGHNLILHRHGCCDDVDCFMDRPLSAVFRADFTGDMISHLYSEIMIWGSRNIKIVKFIFLM